MANKLSRRSQQRIKRMLDGLGAVSDLVNQINADELTDLVRRDAISVAPTSISSSNLNFSRKGGGGASSPVERTVLANANGKKIQDPVRDAEKDIEKNIVAAEKNLRRIQQTMLLIKSGEDKKRVRQTSNPCEICLVLPAVRSAMCMEHYGEWVEAGAPDRARWKAYILQTTSTEGIPLVTEKPAPTRPIPKD